MTCNNYESSTIDYRLFTETKRSSTWKVYPRYAVVRIVKRLVSQFRCSKRYDLSGLSDHHLRDLGLRRDQISAFAHGLPVRRPPSWDRSKIKEAARENESAIAVIEDQMAA
jgi:uncharacterized protein YjiS (DUF1127 family)